MILGTSNNNNSNKWYPLIGSLPILLPSSYGADNVTVLEPGVGVDWSLLHESGLELGCIALWYSCCCLVLIGVHPVGRHKVLTHQDFQVHYCSGGRQLADLTQQACTVVESQLGRLDLSILAPASHTGGFSSEWNIDDGLHLGIQ